MKRLPLFLILAFVASSLVFDLRAEEPVLDALAREFAAKAETERSQAYRLAAEKGWPTSGFGEGGSYFELQKLVNGIPRFYTTFNRNAAISTRADSVNALIGGGSGFVLRMWDGGRPRTTHREYGGRVVWADAASGTIAGHATHVAGTLVASGVRADAKGMSYAATVRAFEWNSDASEMASEAGAGANLSNHSYGFIAGWYYSTSNSYWYWYGDTAISEVEDYSFGFYDSNAQMYDQIAVNAPNYLIVVSSSNDRDDAGPAPGTKHYYYDTRYGAWRFSTKTRNPDGTPLNYDCIPFGFQISKNTLTVGAANDVLSYAGPASVTLAAFSSTGPCDDGRIKPDLVGNGVELISSYSTTDSSYAIASGTSMSSPNVCGSLGLVADYYRDTHGGTPLRSSTLKALAIHTALEAGPAAGPDYQFGWGLLNTRALHRLLERDNADESKGLVEELALANGQTLEYGYRVSGAPAELRVTICWTDPAGTPPSPSLDPSTRMLVNDLDLRVVKGAATNYPWRLDRTNPAAAATKNDNNVDNVEQVVVDAPADGVYTIRIGHKGTLSGGSQNVSLVVTGAEKNRVWHVFDDGSGDAPTIATAVSYAADGDSIYVHPGVYYEAGISIDKALVITSAGGAAVTTIDGNGLGSGIFTFPSSTKTIRASGFTVMNGSASIMGGGMWIQNSNVTVSDCVFEDCHSAHYGGGVGISNASPSITRCSFLGNTAQNDGGGLYISNASAAVDSCVFYGNGAVTGSGGGVAAVFSSPQLENCTISFNSAGNRGGNVYVGNTGNVALARCIVSHSAAGEGIYGEATAVGASLACCDVFGNAAGDYGGSIADQTGVGGNISAEPLFCGAGGSPPDLSIASLSPCAPARSPCGELIGALPVACVIGPDVAITGVLWSDTAPAFGDSVAAAVTVKNLGVLPAVRFYVDYYAASDTLPPDGTIGDRRLFVDSLAAGDSLVWAAGWEKATVFEKWISWFRADNGDSVLETDEANNASGPHEILWRFAAQPGWPVALGFGFHASPAIANLDDDASTLEIVIGGDDGAVHVLAIDGSELPGWPAMTGDTLFSSPAVADVTGDYRREVVIGGRDGKMYVFDRHGVKLWDYDTGSPILTTPALVDLDGDGKCEVICGAGSSLIALGGDGAPYGGSWPVTTASGAFTSPAVGDVDGDGAPEIAAIAYGTPDAFSSRVYLLNADGTPYGAAWPATVDTIVTADPVLGDVVDPSGDLEIVAGGLDGRVYVWKTDGTLWSSPPKAPGAIESSPALANLDADPNLEIVVASRTAAGTALTAIDHTGAVMSGWPQEWAAAGSFVPSPVVIGGRVEAVVGDGSRALYSRDGGGGTPYGFPVSLGGEMLVSAAAGDIDGDGVVELVVAAGAPGYALHVFKLPAADYAKSDLPWPMFRHDRARTGCFGSYVPTPVDGGPGAAPALTAIGAVYPNPFNPSTRIAFTVAKRARIEMAIYDITGRRIAVLLGEEMEPGRYEVSWDGRTVSGAVAASGVYVCRLQAGRLVETRKLVLLR
jgi:hypothetical protein